MQPVKMAVNTTVKYHSVEGFQEHTLFDYHMEEYNWPLYSPLYVTALQTSRQNLDEPRDQFGNVRIPDISSLVPNNGTFEANFNWHDIGSEVVPTYTSLYGVPMVDIPKSGNISFTLDFSYWEIRCSPFVPTLQGTALRKLAWDLEATALICLLKPRTKVTRRGLSITTDRNFYSNTRLRGICPVVDRVFGRI